MVENDNKEQEENSIKLQDWRNFGLDLWSFLKENEIVKFIAVILLVFLAIFLLSKIINYKVLTILAYLLGIVFIGGIVYYFYRDWDAKRKRLNMLEEKYDSLIEEELEDEDFRQEILDGKQKKSSK